MCPNENIPNENSNQNIISYIAMMLMAQKFHTSH